VLFCSRFDRFAPAQYALRSRLSIAALEQSDSTSNKLEVGNSDDVTDEDNLIHVNHVCGKHKDISTAEWLKTWTKQLSFDIEGASALLIAIAVAVSFAQVISAFVQRGNLGNREN
jgi:hypothetical protein